MATDVEDVGRDGVRDEHDGEVELGDGVAAFGSQAIELDRARIVGRQALATLVKVAESAEGLGVVLGGSLLEPLGGSGWGVVAKAEQQAERVLGLSRAGLGRGFEVGPDANDVRFGFVQATLPRLKEPVGGEAGIAVTAGFSGAVPATEQLHGVGVAATGELGAKCSRRDELPGIERGNNFGKRRHFHHLPVQAWIIGMDAKFTLSIRIPGS